MRKLYFGMFVVAFIFVSYWLLLTFDSNSKKHDALKSDTEVLFIICTMVKTDVSSARIAENTIMLRQSFENMSPVVIEKKKQFIISALESAEDSANVYNNITSKYTERQIGNLNLPYKLETEINTDTVIKCTNRK